MTTLTEATLDLRADHAAEIPRWHGAILREWLVGQMPDNVREAAHPPDGRLPYTVSNLLPEGGKRGDTRTLTPDRSYRLRVTALNDETSAWLAEWATGDGLSPLALAGEGGALRVHATQVQQTTCEALTRQSALDDRTLSAQITLQLRSPAVFRQHGMFTALPTPYLIYRGLGETWNRFNDVQLHPDTDTFAAERIAVSGHQLHGQRVHLPDTQFPPMTGTTGWLRMVIVSKDRYWRGIAHTLAAYAAFAGIGIRTAVGMGQAAVEQRKQP